MPLPLTWKKTPELNISHVQTLNLQRNLHLLAKSFNWQFPNQEFQGIIVEREGDSLEIP